jgi:ornithine cyclodeaminase/alanine dehydrogenase-like protein (mu-crystallin family)
VPPSPKSSRSRTRDRARAPAAETAARSPVNVQAVDCVQEAIEKADIDDETVGRSYYVADCRSHALEPAGELRHAMECGYVGEDHIAAEIGEILNGTKRADPTRRRSPSTNRSVTWRRIYGWRMPYLPDWIARNR